MAETTSDEGVVLTERKDIPPPHRQQMQFQFSSPAPAEFFKFQNELRSHLMNLSFPSNQASEDAVVKNEDEPNVDPAEKVRQIAAAGRTRPSLLLRAQQQYQRKPSMLPTILNKIRMALAIGVPLVIMWWFWPSIKTMFYKGSSSQIEDATEAVAEEAAD